MLTTPRSAPVTEEKPGEGNSLCNNENVSGSTAKSSDVKERILGAARKLFVEKGYDGVSIRDIAARSDTNVAMVNYYFRSKYNLFELIFGEAFEVLIDEILNALDSDRPFLQTVEIWIETYYDVLSRYPGLPNFIFSTVHRHAQNMVDRAVSHNIPQLFDRVSARIEKETAAGIIKTTPPLDFVLNIASLCLFPFIMKPLAMEIAEKNDLEYGQMLEKHKTYVIKFVIDAIRA